MEFRLTPEQESFRREVGAFAATEWTGDSEGALGEGGDEASWQRFQAFRRKLAGRGWLTLAWPAEWGGTGAGYIEQAVYNEEMALHGAPAIDMAADRIGPTIMMYGTDAQKQEFLPPIVRGEANWCQGFSEPNAGSDLAALQTRAEEQGDDFIINGQKIWTSNAHRADWMILLARTDQDVPKHKGISYFILDMHSPGVTVRPLLNLSGAHGFNEVFFENVRIPRDRLVGELNRGWYVATTTLDFERSGIGRIAGASRTLAMVTQFAREQAKRAALPSWARHGLAELNLEFEIGRLLAYRVAWMQSSGLVPNYEASISKTFGSEMQQRLAGFGIRLLGLAGQLEPGSEWAPLQGRLQRYYLGSVALTIAAGTSEVNRNIVATRGLGLPRG